MRAILLVAMLGLVGAAPGGCGGSDPAPPPYVCADPCPGATVVTTLANGQLWCFIENGGGLGTACSFAMDPPKTPEQCIATALYWTEHYSAHCY